MSINVPITAKENIEHLKKYEPDTEMIIVVWSKNDIIDYAQSKNVEISEERALEILASIKKYHDCTMGITWDTINCYL